MAITDHRSTSFFNRPGSKPGKSKKSLLQRLLAPLRAVQSLTKQWMRKRIVKVDHGRDIGRRQVYIVPSRMGYAFVFIVLAMLLVAMNYSNNMTFALAFLMIAIGLLCMHHTNGNLLQIRIEAGRVDPIFAGEDIHFPIIVKNSSPLTRYSLQIQRLGEYEDEVTDIDDVPGGDSSILNLRLRSERRGIVQAPKFSVFSEFPLGLFHAWTWMNPQWHAVVYPKPSTRSLPFPESSGERGHRSGQRSGMDDFANLKEYRPGDPPKRIHWKSYSRNRQLVTKEFSDPQDDELWLDWDALEGLDTEQRLSQLCRWVIEAHRETRLYGLRLPGEEIQPNSGETHKHACLRSLALFGVDSASSNR